MTTHAVLLAPPADTDEEALDNWAAALDKVACAWPRRTVVVGTALLRNAATLCCAMHAVARLALFVRLAFAFAWPPFAFGVCVAAVCVCGCG